MPQMAPIWWSTMFIMFIMTYLMFFMMLYFQQNHKILNKMKNHKMNKNLNWKW